MLFKYVAIIYIKEEKKNQKDQKSDSLANLLKICYNNQDQTGEIATKLRWKFIPNFTPKSQEVMGYYKMLQVWAMSTTPVFIRVCEVMKSYGKCQTHFPTMKSLDK